MTINWQPITTAPLDGTRILLYDGYDVWKGFYIGYKKKWYSENTDPTAHYKYELFHEPTHWLPISDLLQPLGHLL